MWTADIVCDLDWFVGCHGVLGKPKLVVRVPSAGMTTSVQLAIFGSEFKVQHVRVLMAVDSYEAASVCVNQNHQYWINSLEVATGLLTDETVSAFVPKGTNEYMVILAEGDCDSPPVELTPIHAAPVLLNYEVFGTCLSNWSSDSRPYLFYLGRFLNQGLPLDVRWLNGYRLAELHLLLRRGGRKLLGNAKWTTLLSEFEPELRPHMRDGQKPANYLEGVRASVAHAILDVRSEDERVRKPGDHVRWTFPIIKKLVVRIVNDRNIRIGNLELKA